MGSPIQIYVCMLKAGLICQAFDLVACFLSTGFKLEGIETFLVWDIYRAELTGDSLVDVA